MKLKVCTKKGKQEFWRAGILFNPNPIIVEVNEDVAARLFGEDMLIVEEVKEEVKEVKEAVEKVVVEEVKEVAGEVEKEPKIKFIPPKRGRPKK